MENPYDAVRELVSKAKSLEHATAIHAELMGQLLAGNLRRISSQSTLAALKKELDQYNIHTGRWKPK